MDHKAAAADRFEAVAAKLEQISRWMYDNPELSLEEFATSARLAGFLEQQGFEVEYPAFGVETAFAARAGSEGPEVVVCAEYDALPGVGHACGHNLIATAALGAGVALLPLAGELGFRLTILGTPAEETRGGKIDLIDAGAFSGAAAALMVHPTPDDLVDPAELAIRQIDVTFHGKESHAAMAPELGINALDAFVQAYVNVSTLRQAMLPTDLVHGIITHGGDAPNIIPVMTRSSWYVRAATADRLAVLYDKVAACFEAAALATGCTCEIEPAGHPFDDLVSHPLLVDLFAANCEALGRPMPRRAAGPPLAGGSTDMGNVSHVVPSIQPHMGIDPGTAVNHQPEFAAHTLTGDGLRMMRDGALAMAGTIIDLAAGDRWSELRTEEE
ncbi:MAG: amidohydrolase [Actinobacteria bacterium]|nr:amidohydrolase [Actinomycetota bacterium]